MDKINKNILGVAGFRQSTVRGDYTDEPATPDSKEMIFSAQVVQLRNLRFPHVKKL